MVKVGLLVRSGYFQNNKQKENLIVLQRQIRMLSLTIISFTTVAYSYDRNYLMVLLAKVRKKLQIIVSENLSEKSMQRLQIIFEYIEKVCIIFIFGVLTFPLNLQFPPLFQQFPSEIRKKISKLFLPYSFIKISLKFTLTKLYLLRL